MNVLHTDLGVCVCVCVCGCDFPVSSFAALCHFYTRRPAVSSQRLVVQSSGSDLPVIDLKRVCKRMCDDILEHGCDLLVLEGMGRAIETNLHAVFQ